MIFSCAKEENFLVNANEHLDLKSDIRSNSSCTNFVSNGDFSANSIVAPFCLDNLNLVDDWYTILGQPYVYEPECFNCPANSTNTEHLDINQSLSGTDLVGQQLGNLPNDADIIYSFCFDAAVTSNQNGVRIQIVNNFDQNILITNQYQQGCNNSLQAYTSNPFQIGAAQSSELRLSISDNQIGSMHIDNLQLTCESDLLQGIQADQNDCIFDFSAILSGQLNITSYYWEFGDGNTSTQASPQHTYAEEDQYIVTLTIVDDRGCCTITELMVDCGPPICTYHLCWDLMPPVVRYFYVDDIEFEFDPPMHIAGNYDEIVETINNWMDVYPIDFGQFISMHNDFPCMKGIYPVESFIYIGSPIEIQRFEGATHSGAPVVSNFIETDCN